jgi:hypothetical protein
MVVWFQIGTIADCTPGDCNVERSRLPKLRTQVRFERRNGYVAQATKKKNSIDDLRELRIWTSDEHN